MTLAIPYIPTVDPFVAWQSANDVAWCQRLTALLSVTACRQNQKRTGLDCRCDGCGGLDNQTAPPRQQLSLILSKSKSPVIGSAAPTEPLAIAAPMGSFSALDEVIDNPRADPLTGDDSDSTELEDEELLALFPELAEDPWPDYPRFSEYHDETPRRAVYRGRCKKCGGYMEYARERHDDNVFRCFSCGWRTSPEYERNRAIHAKWGVI